MSASVAEAPSSVRVGAWSLLGRHRAAIALGVLLVGVAAAAGQQAWLDSPTVDEPTYVAAGVEAWTRHTLADNPQHPPLGKALAALPVLFARLRMPPAHGAFFAPFMHRVIASGQLHEVTFLSRLVPIGELLLCTVVVFALGRRLAGDLGGLFAAAMWALDPFVIGLGHVDSMDLAFTTTVLLSALAAWRWVERPGPRPLVVLGLAVGAAVSTRPTGWLVLAAAALVVAVRSRSWRATAAVVAIPYAVTWLAYIVFDPAYTLSHLDALPQRYVDGMRRLAHLDNGRPAYLFGHHWSGGQWWFWPGSMVVKLPIPLLLAMAVSAWRLWRLPRPERRTALLVLGPVTVLLAGFTMTAPQDPGLRYLMPVVALLCVPTALLVRLRPRLPRPRVVTGVAAGALATASALTLLSSLPDSLSWTDPLLGPSYTVAANSNVDWGQDRGELAQWAAGRDPWVRIDQGHGLGPVPGTRPLPRDAPPGSIHGWVAISATKLNSKRADPWLMHRQPAGSIDGSIVLYHLP